MGIPSSGNISIKSAAGSGRSIDAENTAVSSGSLVTLSQNAIEGLSTLNESPYAMSEFYSYQHAWSTDFTFYETVVGKAEITRYHMTLDDNTMTLSDGSDYTFNVISSLGVPHGFRIRFTAKDGVALTASSPFPTGWHSVTVESSAITNWTLLRTAFSEVTVVDQKHFQKDDGVYYMAASGSGTMTINFS